MQIAIYARGSTQRQAQAQTTDQQLDRLRAHAEGQGWSLAPDRVFRDDGYSGASLRRPGLDRLRDAAASARLDRILITEPDRLARNCERPAGPHPDHRAGPVGAQLRAPGAPGRGAGGARGGGRVPRPADEPGSARPAAAADP